MGLAQKGEAKVGRGRPRGSDRDAMLDHAAMPSDRHGYEGLSIVDLATEFDLTHSRLYKTVQTDASTEALSLVTDGSLLADRLAELVRQVPGATERELTDLLYGDAAGPGRLTFWCHLLLNRGVIERSGVGGRQDPYRYRFTGAA